MNPSRVRLPAGLLLVAVLVAAAGCVPNVVWLPDSSGFVFTRKEGGELVLYDVAKRSDRIVAGDTGTKTVWPAVSPDGKRVALARLKTATDKPGSLEVIVYDLAGKELKRSAAVEWGGPRSLTGSEIEATYLFWAPAGEKLIVWGTSGEVVTGVYDLKSDRMTKLGTGYPVVCGGTPVLPDGKRFLVATLKDGKFAGLAVVDWEGKQEEVAVKGPVDDDVSGLLLLAPLYASRWDGNVATVAKGTGVWRIDAVKRMATYDPQGRKAPTADGAEVAQEYAFAGGATLRVLLWEEGTGNDKKTFWKAEALSKDGKAHLLVEKTEDWCLLVPAPNKKLAALRRPEKVLVINPDGQIVEVPAGDK